MAGHNGTLSGVARGGSPDASGDEILLIQRARGGDRAAFGGLYDLHYKAVAGYIYRRTGDRHVTEDLVGETFMNALRAIHAFEERGLPLRLWLLKIATNSVNRWARAGAVRSRVRFVPDPDAGAITGVAQGVKVEDAESARLALVSLAPKYQTVVALHYLEGLTVREVAEVVGVGEGTIKSRLSRARRLMRKRLETAEKDGAR